MTDRHASPPAIQQPRGRERWALGMVLAGGLIAVALAIWFAAKPSSFAAWQRECRDLYGRATSAQDTLKADWYVVAYGANRSTVQNQTCGGLRLSGKL